MNAHLPLITVIGTGGTIAGKADSASATTGYVPGSATVEDIIASVPGVSETAQIRAVQVSNIGSEDMTDDVWAKLVKECEKQLSDPEVAGVVITHGTDTLEETAFLLNLLLKSDKPVVVVGSMRPSTSISADGPMNLLNALRTAVSPQAKGQGVLVVLNDEIHGARDVTKTNTTNCATFVSPRLGALGLISGSNVEFFKSSTKPHTTRSEFSSELLKEDSALPVADVIYAHAGDDRRLIDAAVETGAQGIVYAGFGNGSVHYRAFEGLKAARAAGLPVIRASRVGSGSVVDSSAEWTQAGLINAGTLNPQKARILLQLCLASGFDAQKIKEVFATY